MKHQLGPKDSAVPRKNLIVCCPWHSCLSWDSQETRCQKDSEENMYLISKGIRAAWSSQIYRGYALLTENRVKRWIIDPYRIIHRPRTVMATKTERSFTFYLKFIPLVRPSSELLEIFFFPFLSSSLSGSSPDASCQSVPSHCLVRWWRACEWRQWLVLWRC